MLDYCFASGPARGRRVKRERGLGAEDPADEADIAELTIVGTPPKPKPKRRPKSTRLEANAETEVVVSSREEEKSRSRTPPRRTRSGMCFLFFKT